MSEEIKSNMSKLGLSILQGAFLIGISGDFLLRLMPWGLNVFFWILLIFATLVGLTFNRGRDYWNKETIMLHGSLLFFAATFLYRASIPLLLLNVAAIFALAAILTLPALRINPKYAGASHYLLGLAWSAVNGLISPFLLIFNDVAWKGTDDSSWRKTLFPVIRGGLIATPLLIIFGGLFMAADAAFEGLVKRTINIDTGVVFEHLLLIGILSWIIAGYLRASFYGNMFSGFLPKSDTPPVGDIPRKDWREFNSSWLPNTLNLGTIEISIIWGLMNILFLTFVVMQLPYLFGGIEYVQNAENVKLADYARRGVAELGLVTILVLPVLLIGHWFINQNNKTAAKLFNAMAAIQIGLLFVIMLSSAQRMMLYTGRFGYGLTLERLYAMVFLVVLGAIFVWFAGTILIGQRQKFAWGMLWISLFTIGFLNIMNPEDFVLRTNVQLKQQGRQFDALYNFTELHEDAIPRAIEMIPYLTESERCFAENELRALDDRRRETDDWRNWNYSRANARKVMEAYKLRNGILEWESKTCAQYLR